MGRFRVVLFSSLGIGLLALSLGQGCRDATQVTLDISLAQRANCTETKGTAITVGVDPAGTEDRVLHEYVTAATSSCDSATHEIGTLVLTPGESGLASVIVVVAYGEGTAVSCKPPLYKGCIVARRRFAFSDHKHLQMPITIDPDCKDVPCDAFSTCRTGKCFSSDTACDGDSCTQPGDPGDGGTAVDGQVIPDTGVPGDGAVTDGAVVDGAIVDGSPGTDGGTDGSVTPDGGTGSFPPNVFCNDLGQLECPNPFTCLGANSCCGPSDGTSAACQMGTASCNAAAGEHQYCCPMTTCAAGKTCVIGMGLEAGPPPPLPVMPLPPAFMANANLPAGATPAGLCQ